MCDYYADPVWTGDRKRQLALDSLPLSERTKADLRAWARWFDTALDRNFEWPAAENDAFDSEGVRLWRRVSDELGPTYRVGYFSEVVGRPVWDPAELLADGQGSR